MSSYYTEIDIEMCKTLIDMQINSKSYQRREIRGEVDFDNNKFKLFKARRDGRYRVFYGELIKEESGTIIKGEFQTPTEMIILRGVSVATGMLIWLNHFTDMILGKSKGSAETIIILILFTAVIIIQALILIKFDYVEEEEKNILHIIETKLNATFILADEK